jgi:hypothetical protein
VDFWLTLRSPARSTTSLDNLISTNPKNPNNPDQEDADCPGRAACQNDPYTYKHPFYCEGWGRPADVEWLVNNRCMEISFVNDNIYDSPVIKDDGSLLVSDEMNGVVYRVTYKGIVDTIFHVLLFVLAEIKITGPVFRTIDDSIR